MRSACDGSGGAATTGVSGVAASGARSSRDPARVTPASPSAATWCTTTISANRSPGSPSTISARHNGRSSGRGRTIRSAAQVTRSAPTGRVAPSMCRSGSNAGSGAQTGIPSPNRVQTTRRRKPSTRRGRATSSRRTRGTSSVLSEQEEGRGVEHAQQGDLEGREPVGHPGVDQLVHAQSGQRHAPTVLAPGSPRQGPTSRCTAVEWHRLGSGDARSPMLEPVTADPTRENP